MTASTSREGLRGELRQLISVPVIAIAIVLFGIYLWFDLRAGGRNNTLTTTKLTTPADLWSSMGGLFLISMIVLNVVLALVSAILLVQSYRMIRARREGGAAGACTTGGSLLLGFFAFSCPSCSLPILATIGVTFAATSLPLYGLEFKLLALIGVFLMLVWLRRRQMAMRASASPPE